MSREYTRESVERALDHHKAQGRIRSWDQVEGGGYAVWLNRGVHNPALELRSLREAWVLVAGLASAGYAGKRAS